MNELRAWHHHARLVNFNAEWMLLLIHKNACASVIVDSGINDGLSNNEQSSPTGISALLDAGLQGYMEIAAINFVEELFDIEDLSGCQIFEVAVGAVGAESLVL